MKEQKLLSVGIDIGTSTTQLVFSEITVLNVASGFSVPKMEIADKKIIYKSDIHFTPLKSETEIDAEKTLEIIKSEYQKAGYSVKDPDTGAVIITGETARKENARAVLQSLSDFSGDFVVATAGADLESVLSGKAQVLTAFQRSFEPFVQILILAAARPISRFSREVKSKTPPALISAEGLSATTKTKSLPIFHQRLKI